MGYEIVGSPDTFMYVLTIEVMGSDNTVYQDIFIVTHHPIICKPKTNMGYEDMAYQKLFVHMGY